MKRRTLIALLFAVLAIPAIAGDATGAAKPRTFGWQGDHFLLDGKPFVILSGEMHYARVPRPYWRDRMRKMRAMGLNTLCTYIFWNLHEPRPGLFDFAGNLDVAAFVRTAREEGLWVIVRPGPYICTEWDFGGLPAWLLSDENMKVRSTQPAFLRAAKSYMERVGKELAPLQIGNGGPIIMAQVENEYGSFGHDHNYMAAVRDMIRDSGFNITLYTSDGSDPHNVSGGSLPDVLSVINFGAGNPAKEFDSFDAFRRSVPRMCGEYWVGWFDHWGEVHHTVSPRAAAEGLEWMLSRGISANLYMFHGGTTFGFMAGANYEKGYQPDISSYDYDAPLDEAGRPTEKFFALRNVIKKHLPAGSELPDLPAPLPMIDIPQFELTEAAALPDPVGDAVRSDMPKPMEALGQYYGVILYRNTLGQPFSGVLNLSDEPRDYAIVRQGTRTLGTLDRRMHERTLQVDLVVDRPLDIIVENMGRINFGPESVADRKGLASPVKLNGKEAKNWEMYLLPLAPPTAPHFSTTPVAGPAYYRANVDLTFVGDTFVDMRGWGKGYVWVNGHNLGRYWHVGPQQSLFVPAEWLREGKNEFVVFDFEPGRKRFLNATKNPIWETPAKTN